MCPEKFHKSRSFALDKIKHSILTCVYTLLVNTLEIKFQLFYTFWMSLPNELDYIQEYIWISSLLIFYYLLDLPLSYYDSCIIKNKYASLQKSLESFCAQEIRFFLMLLLIISPLITVALNFIKNIAHFWILSWIFFTFILIFLICVYPGYISPFCEKYHVYPQCQLKKAIINFCDTFGINILEVFELKTQSFNQHSNIWIGKRFCGYYVIIDKNDLCQNEILALLAHEIGHNYYCHHKKLIIMYSFYYFFMVACFSWVSSLNRMTSILGFPNDIRPEVVNIVAVFIYVLAPLNKFIRYYLNVFTREIECEADRFVVDSGLGEELIDAIIKRSRLLDVICVFDEKYSLWVLSQPPLVERLRMLKAMIRCDDVSCSFDDVNCTFDSSSLSVRSRSLSCDSDSNSSLNCG